MVAEIFARTVPSGTCLRWTGAHTSKGYGQVWHDGRVQAVHRVVFVGSGGVLPAGFEVDHVHAAGCRWRDCVNPQHLAAVTHAENLSRARAAAPICPQGHDRGTAGRCAVCHRDAVRRYRARLAGGAPHG